MKLRVLLADDHALLRDALHMVLELAPDIEVVGEAIDGNDVLRMVGESRADVVCMDLTMPGLNGVEATRQLLAKYPNVKVIGLSAHRDQRRVATMIEAGAHGYVVKSDAGTELLQAIRKVCQNQTYFSAVLGIRDPSA
ncbi:MAG: response regulator transcription factor [Proteobacteria bacterium]|nr:response regulator transcription factor [Pseudomonadota bacterium]